jgi:hypothetical protein
LGVTPRCGGKKYRPGTAEYDIEVNAIDQVAKANQQRVMEKIQSHEDGERQKIYQR